MLTGVDHVKCYLQLLKGYEKMEQVNFYKLNVDASSDIAEALWGSGNSKFNYF